MAIYNLKTMRRSARPRSKRLRELGVSESHSSGSTVVNINGGSSGGSNHYHSNKVALDQISTDDAGYQYLTRLSETTDDDGNAAYESITEKVKAGYADFAGGMSEEALAKLPYLSKLADDVAAGNITFEQMITTLGLALFRGGAQFGNFINSMTAGAGAAIDDGGNAEFESVKVRTYFESLEMIINRISAIEGDQILTEADTIERVEVSSTGKYRLYFKSKYDGYVTAQVINNILRGIYNDAGTYRTCWLRVDRVNTAYNYIDATMFPDADTPAGQNFPPCELMRVARWGNQSDTARQSCIYLSSTEGRIVRLTGVTAPKLTAANYGVTVGTLPEFLASMNLPVVAGQDYVYARGLVVQDIIRIDHQGKPQAEIVDRGQWKSGSAYYCAAQNSSTGIYETSDVWHYGCRFRCAKTGTMAEPGYGVTDWAMVEGNPELMVGFAEDIVFCNPENFEAKLTLVVKAFNQDITDTIADSDVSWSRYSETAEGEPRQFEDALWGQSRANAGKILTLSLNDLSYDAASPPRVVRFIVTVNK